MRNKTWNITLNPDSPVETTVAGVSNAEMERSLFETLYGSGRFEPRADDDTASLRLAA